MPLYKCTVFEGSLCLKVCVHDKAEAFRYMQMMLEWLEGESPFSWSKKNIGFDMEEVEECFDESSEDKGDDQDEDEEMNE
jgi:hypothetical protein